ncbi:MAG: hypothetical protein JSS86_00640 [Cyanobacteria bacterium SZAS LIN-2]|nr:hypothetical protein [Cyanobacteria bacterium SZAS LIN-2]
MSYGQPRTNRFGDYGDDEYFAFIESFDEFAWPEETSDGPSWWHVIGEERERQKRPPATHLVWLDCVVARWFWNLDWREEPCEIGDAAQAAIRRSLILDLPKENFRVAPLFLSTELKEEYVLMANLAEADWHRVRLGPGAGIPTLIAPSYDLIPAQPGSVSFEYGSLCSEPERPALRNVFNLNFIPYAGFDEGERGPNRGGPPPQGPKPRQDESSWGQYETFQKMVR